MRELLAAGLAAASLAGMQAAAEAASPSQWQAARLALSAQSLAFSPRLDGTGGFTVPVQLPSCGIPGATRCVNGWVWRCECDPTGCHWTTSTERCQR